MVGAHIAFKKVVDSTVIQIMDYEWTRIGAAAPHTPPATTYRNFKKHYCQGLREYYINSQMTSTSKKDHAYAEDALTATVGHLQSEVDINRQNVSTIASTQDQMLTQPEAYSTHYVPSVVSSTTATTPSGLANSATDQRLDKLESMLQQLMQVFNNLNQQSSHSSNQNSNTNCTRRGTIRGDPNGPWRQWKYWCYSCGTNLNHSSMDCHRTKKQHQNHNQYKSTATKDNPQGGNSNKDHLWMKWCDPGTWEQCDTKKGE